ncbi:MAG: hypothetical protein IKE95_10035 [Methanobrevibacter sp.]|nr:hypothetical protein [Methanobrevibacter sp.]
MILNKYVSMLLSACLFMLLMFVTSSVSVFVKGGFVQYIGLVFIVVYYFIARVFYNYLRNDDVYKNSRKYSSDREGEKYLYKGESDNKKIFIIVWILVILFLSAISLWAYSVNNGLI